MNTPRYPKVEVQLSGEDGNAFFIIGRTTKALRQGGATAEDIAEYQEDAMSGDYDHVLQTTMSWVNVS
jgi:hypothetical protein